jgi:hypothetical protein
LEKKEEASTAESEVNVEEIDLISDSDDDSQEGVSELLLVAVRRFTWP